MKSIKKGFGRFFEKSLENPALEIIGNIKLILVIHTLGYTEF